MGEVTIKNGATSQFIRILNAIWIQISRFRNTWCSVSYLTLHKMGYIMTSKPIAVAISTVLKAIQAAMMHTPIGTETPTNLPFCNAGPVLGTKFPSMMPIAIANSIQRARNRSSQPKLLNAETLSGAMAPSISCFSASCPGSSGAVVSWLNGEEETVAVVPDWWRGVCLLKSCASDLMMHKMSRDVLTACGNEKGIYGKELSSFPRVGDD